MGLHTPMHEMHLAMGAKMISFGGWEMPLHYGSQVEEHQQVRNECGVFDVSHMSITDVSGTQAIEFLQMLLSNDVACLDIGNGHYTAMLNTKGGVIDDLIAFRTEKGLRLINNAATRQRITQWLQQHAEGYAVTIEQRTDLAHFAIQGPTTMEHLPNIFSNSRMQLISQLAPYQCVEDGDWFFSRTGYTGEEGIEIILPVADSIGLFNDLIANGIPPIGLGARDTLRLEAGFTLLGKDMNEEVSPYSANMHHVVAMQPQERKFIGREALEQQLTNGIAQKLVGLVLEERGVLRSGQPVRISGGVDGVITSGSYSPTIGKAIALARVPVNTAERGEVEIRGKWHPVRVVKPRFVRNGKILI